VLSGPFMEWPWPTKLGHGPLVSLARVRHNPPVVALQPERQRRISHRGHHAPPWGRRPSAPSGPTSSATYGCAPRWVGSSIVGVGEDSSSGLRTCFDGMRTLSGASGGDGMGNGIEQSPQPCCRSLFERRLTDYSASEYDHSVLPECSKARPVSCRRLVLRAHRKGGRQDGRED
jgi:hypothetical protein